MLSTLQNEGRKKLQLRTCFLLITVNSREAYWTVTGVFVDTIDADAAIFTGPACTFVNICEGKDNMDGCISVLISISKSSYSAQIHHHVY